MKLRNVSPLGDLDIPLVRRIVLSGEEFDVTAEQAARLLEQHPVNYVPADDEAEALHTDLTATPEGNDVS